MVPMMIDRRGEIWKYLTTGEIFFVDSEPRKFESSFNHEIDTIVHEGINLTDGIRRRSGEHCGWFERPSREWGTIASHMRRIA